MPRLLDALDHACFHSPTPNMHVHPNLHHCLEPNCPGCISEELAQKAGYVDAEGNIKCPCCDCHTYPSGERRVFEVHAKLCTDPTIHYPEMRKRGEISEEQYQAWKATLTPAELMGRYKRVEDIHVTATFYHDEAALIDTDLDAFNALLRERLRDRAEAALLHQAQHRHRTHSKNVQL